MARTLVRIEKVDRKGVRAVIPGWNWRKTLRFNSHPKTLIVPDDVKDRDEMIFYAYARINYKAERAKDLELVWCD